MEAGGGADPSAEVAHAAAAEDPGTTVAAAAVPGPDPAPGTPLPSAAPRGRRRRVPSSDPAAGPALPESLVRRRRRGPRRGSSPGSSRLTCRRPSWPRARGSRTSARSPSAWRWVGPCGASSSSGSRRSSGELNLGFTQLAALYVLAEGATTTVSDLAEAIGRSPSATSRLVDGLVRRRLVERRREEDDGRQRSVWLTARGRAVLRMVDRARAEQFLSAVRPMPRGERALIAMGVAALATHAISRRGRLVRSDT